MNKLDKKCFSGRCVPWSDLYEGGGGADGRDPGQELRLLRPVDPQQHQDGRV